MPRLPFKSPTRLLGIILPLATLATFFALFAAGGMPQFGALPDLLTYVLELAPRTLYAVAIVGCSAYCMHRFDMNLPHDVRAQLLEKATNPNELDHCSRQAALAAWRFESLCWLAWAALFTVVFHPWG